jgi:hypothetical protein
MPACPHAFNQLDEGVVILRARHRRGSQQGLIVASNAVMSIVAKFENVSDTA